MGWRKAKWVRLLALLFLTRLLGPLEEAIDGELTAGFAASLQPSSRSVLRRGVHSNTGTPLGKVLSQSLATPEVGNVQYKFVRALCSSGDKVGCNASFGQAAEIWRSGFAFQQAKMAKVAHEGAAC